MIAKFVEDQMLEFVREMIRDLNQYIIAEIEALDYDNLVFVVQQDHELIMRAVIILYDYLLLSVILRPEEGELVTLAEMRLKIPQLINNMIDGHNSDILSLLAKDSLNDFTDSFEVDIIDRVEVVITIVSNQMHGIFVNQHHTSHLLIVEGSHQLAHQYLFLVVFVLALGLL